MKKFKIDNVEIYANSIHDALEIYKHKVKDEENVIYEVATAKIKGGRMDHEYFESKEELLSKYPGKDNGSVVKLQGFSGPFNNGLKNGKKVLRYEDLNASYMDSKLKEVDLVKDSKVKDEDFNPGDKVRYHEYGFNNWVEAVVKAKKETNYGTRYDLRTKYGFDKKGIPAEHLEKLRDSKVKDGRYIHVSGKAKSAQGYEIRGYCLTSEGRMYAVLYRPNTGDYLVAAGYNQQRGDWDQGYYDFKTEEQAIKKAEQLIKMYDSVDDSLVEDVDTVNDSKLKDYTFNKKDVISELERAIAYTKIDDYKAVYGILKRIIWQLNAQS